ncbi:glycosyltransferase [Mesorhizobium sp. B2-3-12]|uniref:glycosyltransferase n=1 Tax=Mesorhizobium sp. B2-3-12 TaxID=2589952 RepID=UPI001125D3C6|nr:glycosyltransferase [Mesorhizobium sp. B2-3-12]TPL80670.1 hypothetical protein FJ948_28725 [Mesorhizobium sp. B2-3-12]
MDTAFIIRFHYGPSDQRFDWRFAYFRSIVLPRILSQTVKEFEIAIWCNPWHQDMFLALSDKIRVFGVRPEADGFIRPEDAERAAEYHIDFTYWRDVVGLPPYRIQIGLDSDDLIRRDYLDRIHREISKSRSNSLHICFQPMIFNLENLTQYDLKADYGPEAGSPFFAIVQNEGAGYIFSYEQSHLKLPKFFANSVKVEPGYCWFTIHDSNASTRLPSTSSPILNP